MSKLQVGSRPNIEGSFSFENLICHLYSCDLRDLCSVTNEAVGNDILKDFHAAESSLYPKTGKWIQQISLRHLDEINLPASLDRVLFHERIHYWQVLTGTMLQFQLATILDKMSAVIEKTGGQPQYVCNQGIYNNSLAQEIVSGSLKSVNSNFNYVSSENIQFVSDNFISENLYTRMPHVRMPHEAGGNITLPGYAAVMGFEGSSEVAVVPFSGRHIVESAAYIAEQLSFGEVLPQLTPNYNYSDLIYLGVWEFWRRIFEKKYKSEEMLALSFLAVVDLVLNPDLFVSMDEEEIYLENVSIPYRFGKLVFRMRDLPLLEIENGDFDKSILKFHERLATCSRWTSPQVVIKKMIVHLGRIVIQSLMSRADSAEIPSHEVDWLFKQSLDIVAKDIKRVEALLATAHKPSVSDDAPRSYRSWPMGINVLSSMIHALFYRLKYPGRFSAPHKFSDELRKAYPLPIILFRGDYFFDSTGWVQQHPDEFSFSTYPMETAMDAIGIAALSPLVHGNTGCGFYEKGIECYFMRAKSVKCPMPYIKNQKKGYDCSDSLDTWCHWVFHATAFRTAPRIVLDHWKELLNS